MFPFFKLTREVILIKSVCQGRKCVFFFFFFTGLARPAHEVCQPSTFFSTLDDGTVFIHGHSVFANLDSLQK